MVRIHAGPQCWCGDVAQVGERLPCTEEARGSNPLISTCSFGLCEVHLTIFVVRLDS